MKTTIKISIITLTMLLATIFYSCTDLSEGPYSVATPDNALIQASAYTSFLGKLYAGLSMSGQQGPSGQGDISGFDEGSSTFLRSLWNVQELTTDEAIMRWGDQTIRELHRHDWTTSDPFVANIYARINYNIALANEFLYEVNQQFPEELEEQKATYVAEARFIRALSYYYLIDMFRKGPLLTEPLDPKGNPPEESETMVLFNFVENELLEIENDLLEPGTQVWGRADRGAAWMLLAKLYLNAEVYIGAPKFSECISACNKIIDSGAYILEPVYRHVFAADNENSSEIIFPITSDGLKQRSYGGMVYIVRAHLNGAWGENIEEFGMAGAGWTGATITPELADLFGPKADGEYSGTVNTEIFGVENTYINDDRYTFFTEEDNHLGETQVRECDTDPYTWSSNEGYRQRKFINLKKDGSHGNIESDYPDNDFPLFRYADVLLMYAEAVLRNGSGGSKAQAVDYLNLLRERANADVITETELNLDWLIEERARELWWEAHRRTDLVRFGLFTSEAWSWKGGIKEGKPSDSKYNVFPVPATVRAANPNLSQNDGY
nr:RagB/SusD family nutrient uptake outer membrane protein [uncultured Draconibacterium sp.]